MRVESGVESVVTTRTTASDGQSCRQCGGPIRGRRRNGYCGDACRMRARRAEDAARRRELLTRLKGIVTAVEVELLNEARDGTRMTQKRSGQQ